MHKFLRPFAAVVLAVVMAVSCLLFAACAEKDPQDEQNPVVLKLGDLKLRKFYFDSLYATNENYYKMSQGAISMSDYFNLITEQMGRYAVTLKDARAMGYQLTAEDGAQVIADRDAQWEHISSVFMDRVDESITGEAERQAEFERLFELDTGYTSELYVQCLEQTLRDRLLIQRYFEKQTDGMEPTDKQVRDYIDLQINNQSNWSFDSFAQKYVQFATGRSEEPSLFVPQDCFTVVQYLIPADAQDDAGSDRMEKELIPNCTAEELIERLGEGNGDEAMTSELFRGWGYPMHESIMGDYSSEFVFAAYRAAGFKSAPGMLPMDFPVFEIFKTKDGRDVIKVSDEEGTHYVMLLRRLKKGNLSYQQGDEIWQYGYEGAMTKLRRKAFDDAIEKEYQEAVKRHRLTWYYDRFKSSYIPTFDIG